ncbi:MAG: transcriptional regulator [Sphingobacteriales bacterium 50-39]|nr:helix-turn-helix transcriptional regulator [Sphingobacteriales bacterium]OJW61185.1 MAG: transcriptional regulator [Sphingobacteriales bacterium 50-39]
MPKLVLNRLKFVLLEKNVKNKELAKALGKTESTVSQWCNNLMQPSLETFYKIANFLDVDMKDLFVSTKKN